MQVITAKTGQLLRDYIKTIPLTERISVFPEAGLDANEQAAFLKENQDKYDTIFTLSPFIISDSKNIVILGYQEDFKPRFGESVNDITMKIWRDVTIGDLANEQLKAYELSEIDENTVKDIHQNLGDSIEKILLLQNIREKTKGIKCK